MNTAQDIIDFVNKRLSTNGLKLSEVAEKYINERFKKTGDEGYSEFWKNSDLSKV